VDRLIAWYRVSSSVGAVVALVLANAIPLLGVLFLGWNVWMLLIVYWLENGIVGTFNVLKILRAEGPADPTATVRMGGRPGSVAGRTGVAGFFLIHYGLFWLVHGVFVLTMPLFAGIGGGFGSVGDGSSGPLAGDPGVPVFPGDPAFPGAGPGFDLGGGMMAGFQPGSVLLAVVALAISHGVSFWFNYLRRGEYRRASPGRLMFAPYGRLVVLHVTIILGAIAVAATGAPAVIAGILVALKVALDLAFHLRAHRAPTPLATTVATG
jgi:hypothetical protein